MRDVPENELFSAYLDGELTAAEEAQVEELLAGSPRARQLLDEFRALSATLQGLPSHKLGEDLSEQVLEQARKQVDSERREDVRPADAPPPPVAEPSVPSEPSRLRRMFSARSLSWSIIAVAVALMIMVFDPGNQGENAADREVARAPEATADSTAAPSEEPAGEMTIRAPETPAALEAADEDDMRAAPAELAEGAAVDAPAADFGRFAKKAPAAAATPGPAAGVPMAEAPLEREAIATKPGPRTDAASPAEPTAPDPAMVAEEPSQPAQAAELAPTAPSTAPEPGRVAAKGDRSEADKTARRGAVSRTNTGGGRSGRQTARVAGALRRDP